MFICLGPLFYQKKSCLTGTRDTFFIFRKGQRFITCCLQILFRVVVQTGKFNSTDGINERLRIDITNKLRNETLAIVWFCSDKNGF